MKTINKMFKNALSPNNVLVRLTFKFYVVEEKYYR